MIVYFGCCCPWTLFLRNGRWERRGTWLKYPQVDFFKNKVSRSIAYWPLTEPSLRDSQLRTNLWNDICRCLSEFQLMTRGDSVSHREDPLGAAVHSGALSVQYLLAEKKKCQEGPWRKHGVVWSREVMGHNDRLNSFPSVHLSFSYLSRFNSFREKKSVRVVFL